MRSLARSIVVGSLLSIGNATSCRDFGDTVSVPGHASGGSAGSTIRGAGGTVALTGSTGGSSLAGSSILQGGRNGGATGAAGLGPGGIPRSEGGNEASGGESGAAGARNFGGSAGGHAGSRTSGGGDPGGIAGSYEPLAGASSGAGGSSQIAGEAGNSGTDTARAGASTTSGGAVIGATSGSPGRAGASTTSGGAVIGDTSGSHGQQAGSAGLAGDSITPTETIPQPPFCAVDRGPNGGFPLLSPVVRIGALAVSTTGDDNNCLQLYATQPANEVVAVTWEPTPGNTSNYIKWVCFDAVPKPNQLSATNMANHSPEVLASTEGGNLFLARGGATYGRDTPWTPVDLPEVTSRIHDVFNFTVLGETDRLYVTDRGRVYGRRKVSIDPYASYGPWQSFGAADAQRITAGVRVDSIEVLFVVTSTGALKTLVAPDQGQGASPEQWIPLAAPEPILDLDCANNGDNALILYVLARSGALYRRVHLLEDTWGSWRLVKGVDSPPVLSAIVVSRVAATGPAVFGLDSNGVVQSLDRQDEWHVVPP